MTKTELEKIAKASNDEISNCKFNIEETKTALNEVQELVISKIKLLPLRVFGAETLSFFYDNLSAENEEVERLVYIDPEDEEKTVSILIYEDGINFRVNGFRVNGMLLYVKAQLKEIMFQDIPTNGKALINCVSALVDLNKCIDYIMERSNEIRNNVSNMITQEVEPYTSTYNALQTLIDELKASNAL